MNDPRLFLAIARAEQTEREMEAAEVAARKRWRVGCAAIVAAVVVVLIIAAVVLWRLT